MQHLSVFRVIDFEMNGAYVHLANPSVRRICAHCAVRWNGSTSPRLQHVFLFSFFVRDHPVAMTLTPPCDLQWAVIDPQVIYNAATAVPPCRLVALALSHSTVRLSC